MSNSTEAASAIPASRWPKLTAGLIALFVAVPATGLGIGMLRPFLDLQAFETQILAAGATTGLLGAVSTFLLLAHQFGARMPQRLLPFAFAIMGFFMALMAGQAATVVAFGEAGPWGDVVKGLTVPFSDGVMAASSAEWWPIPFAIAFTAALMAAGWAWDQARFICAPD